MIVTRVNESLSMLIVREGQQGIAIAREHESQAKEIAAKYPSGRARRRDLIYTDLFEAGCTPTAAKLRAYVTLEVAREWNLECEKTIFFDDVLGELNINVTLTNNPDKFEALQEVFESFCERMLAA